MEKEIMCPACTSAAYCEEMPDEKDMRTFYVCPVCGRFELKWPIEQNDFNRNHLASYLLYHRFLHTCIPKPEYRYHTVQPKEICDQYGEDFKHGNTSHGRPVHIDEEMVENWYPKSFSERIDRILLFFYQQTTYVGQNIKMSVNELLSVLFVDKQCIEQERSNQFYGAWCERNPYDYIDEANFLLRYLKKQSYIEADELSKEKLMREQTILLTPEGYARIDELQKHTAHGRQALVAMKFGDDTKLLREAIRLGIISAGYIAVFIDEVQHNELITPELLKHIRDSKFVVADLTHQNNGAYFEEGYAMGLGKPVIQLCKNGAGMHFDISQINTIMWETEADIPERLKNRIVATID